MSPTNLLQTLIIPFPKKTPGKDPGFERRIAIGIEVWGLPV